MELTQLILHNLLSFILIISFIVFIHEFGHFYVARLCKVKIEAFSIGFGKEIFGFNDKKGTRWKFCIIPLGGYVKMYGDKNAASMPNLEELFKMSETEKQQSFIFKNVYQRIAIVSAGPIANFLLAITLLTFLFNYNGLNTILPIVDEISSQSAAFEAGLKKGDQILQIDDTIINNFDEIRQIVSLSSNKELILKIKRQEKIIDLKITPKYQTTKDIFGDEIKVGMLGITASSVEHKDLSLAQSFIQASQETYRISIAVLEALQQLITGQRSLNELGGPIKIAQYSGKTVNMGIVMVLWFMTMISINLGVMNLLPVPMLDGGHLIFYFIEVARGKALSAKTQQIGFQIGFSLILALMIFTTYNDLKNLFY